MKRVKTKPKKQKKIMVSPTELNKIKRDIERKAIDMMWLVMLAAMVDELDLNEDQLCNVAMRTERYSDYIEDHIVKMEDIRKTIEKKTGIKLKGWT